MSSLVVRPEKTTLSNKFNYYPSFGEENVAPLEKEPESMISRVERVALCILLGFAIGALIAGPIGMAIGAGIGFSVGCAYEAIRSKKISYSNAQRQQKLLADSPILKLGEYHMADVAIFTKAEDSFEAKKKLIQSATKSIELSPNFAGGQDFLDVLGLIQTQLQANVELKVHLILSIDMLEQSDKEQLKKLEKTFQGRFVCLITDRHLSTAGGKLHTEENHVKLLIVDGKYAMVGGTGIHPSMTCSNPGKSRRSSNEPFGARVMDKAINDVDMAFTGKESVPLARQEFFRLFQIWEKRTNGQQAVVVNREFELKKEEPLMRDIKLEELLKNHSNGSLGGKEEMEEGDGKPTASSSSVIFAQNVKIMLAVSGPEHIKNPITRTIRHLIDKAEKSVYLAPLWFNPDSKLENVLKKKAKQKVEESAVEYKTKKGESYKKVDIIGHFNGSDQVVHTVFTSASRPHYHLLTEAYEINEKDSLLHEKVVVIDEKITGIGSSNFGGPKSGFYDHEICVFIDSKDVAKALVQKFQTEQTQSSSRQVTEKEARKGLLFNIFSLYLLEGFAG